MPNLKGTKTELNLMEAFAGESQARNRYTYFADIAKEEGYTQLAETLEQFAVNEREHARKWFKILCGGSVPTTGENLKTAIAGENAEWSGMYPRMAAEAKEEGFNVLAGLFDSIGSIEKRHEAELWELLKEFEGRPPAQNDDNTEKSIWLCRYCGYVVDSETAPRVCAVCEHEDVFYQQKATVYPGDE